MKNVRLTLCLLLLGNAIADAIKMAMQIKPNSDYVIPITIAILLTIILDMFGFDPNNMPDLVEDVKKETGTPDDETLNPL